MFFICFIRQWMKRSKTGFFVFPPKKTLIWRKDCSIGQLCCSMTSKRSISWFLESSRAWSFFTEGSLNQPKATRVCSRLITQANRSVSVCLLFLFCSRVFIWRSYENRSKINIKTRNRTSLYTYTPACPPEHKFFPADSYFRLPAAFLILVDLWSLPKRNHLHNLSWCPKSTYTITNCGRFCRTMVFLPGQTMLTDWSGK